MPVRYLDDGNDDGTCLGQSASAKVAFWGATPATQPVVTAVTTANKTTTLLETQVSRLYAALVTAGIIRTTS